MALLFRAVTQATKVRLELLLVWLSLSSPRCISINITEASLDFTLFLCYIFECNIEEGPQIFNLFTNSVGMDKKAEILKFSATSFTGVLSNAGMIFCPSLYAVSSPHISKITRIMFICTNVSFSIAQ